MTTKELSYLNEALSNEQTIIKKYQEYSSKITDPQIVTVLNDLSNKHQQHYSTLVQQLNS